MLLDGNAGSTVITQLGQDALESGQTLDVSRVVPQQIQT